MMTNTNILSLDSCNSHGRRYMFNLTSSLREKSWAGGEARMWALKLACSQPFGHSAIWPPVGLLRVFHLLSPPRFRCPNWWYAEEKGKADLCKASFPITLPLAPFRDQICTMWLILNSFNSHNLMRYGCCYSHFIEVETELREVKWPARGHTAAKQQCWDSLERLILGHSFLSFLFQIGFTEV